MTNEELTIKITKLIQKLGDGPAMERKLAFSELEEIGYSAVPEITKMLKNQNPELRRAGLYLLGEIRDPSAIPAMMDLLEDPAFEVRWRAAESLVVMGRSVIIPLLLELTRKERFTSAWFLDGAHHILRRLNKKGYIGPSINVLTAMETSDQREMIPWEAERTFELLTHAAMA